MGLGFSFALTCIGAVRELLGAGKIFDYKIMPDTFVPINIFVLAPGAFFVLAALTALQNYIRIKLKKAGKENKKIQSGCSEDCLNCPDTGCARRFYDQKASEKKEKSEKAVKAEEKPEKKAEAKPEKKAEKKAEKKPETKTDKTAEIKPEERSEKTFREIKAEEMEKAEKTLKEEPEKSIKEIKAEAGKEDAKNE